MNDYQPISNDAAGANAQAGITASAELAPAPAAKKSAILPAKALGEAPQGQPAPISAGPSIILGKPVFSVNTSPLNMKSGFRHKLLCDGGTFTGGTACGYSCPYCYVESMVIKQEQVRNILAESGRPFNELVIRRNNAVQRLAQELTRKKRKKEQIQTADKLLAPELIDRWGLKNEWSLTGRVIKYAGPKWESKVIFASPLVDVAPTKVLANETVEMCEVILRLTGFHIRLLSKSPLLADVAEELARRLPDTRTGAKARMIFGFSTGTLDDRIAAAMEQHTPSPTARLKALHRLQDAGFRTFGMLCPILPQRDMASYRTFAKTAMQAIRAEKCEEIWAEAVNFRAGGKMNQGDADDRQQRTSFEATLQALTHGGFKEEAALFDKVARDPAAWEEYSRALFEALVEAVPPQTIPTLIRGEKLKAECPNKLWWLHYPRNAASIRDYWQAQQGKGAVLLGAIATKYPSEQQRGMNCHNGTALDPEIETRRKIYELQHGAGKRRVGNYQTRKALAVLLNGKQATWEEHHNDRGRWTDVRRDRFPDWQMNGCVVLLKFFEVTKGLQWRAKRGLAAHYDGLWKKINREEFEYLTSRFGRDYGMWAYKSRALTLVFNMAERAGIIDRRKGGWMKFNPDKFIEWIEKAEAYRKLHHKTFRH